MPFRLAHRWRDGISKCHIHFVTNFFGGSTDHQRLVGFFLSGDLKKHLIIVDLMVDKESKPPKASGPAKKTSRVLLTWCDPIRDIKSFAIKTADGVRHEVKGEELKK